VRARGAGRLGLRGAGRLGLAERVRGARPDIPSLVAGLAVLVLGGVLLLDALDALELGFALFAPVACGATGAILLANGLGRRE
jgi:hypothetical protein